MAKTNSKTIEERMASGEIIDQKIWKFVKEINSSEERLNAIALKDGRREYTYRQMFRYWDNYAEVFTALNITEKNKSRVGIIAAFGSEAIFSFFGLNMLGVSVSMINIADVMDLDRLIEMLKAENITDLFVPECIAIPKVVKGILSRKEEIGLRNIIMLPVPLTKDYVPPMMATFATHIKKELRHLKGLLFMNELLMKYEATPIAYTKKDNDDAAAIVHTSGTTKGIHKPIPLSDRGINFKLHAILGMPEFENIKGGKTAPINDFSSAYAFIDSTLLPLVYGCQLVIIPLGFTNQRFPEVVKREEIDVQFAASILFERQKLLPPEQRMNFSNRKAIVLGGSYISGDLRKRINEHIKDHGGTIKVMNGYGLSECSGACILSGPDDEGDTIGRPLPGIKVKIYNEEDQKFYNLEDDVEKGVLYISAPSVSSGKIDDTVFFELEDVDGEPYLCTYDLVRVNKDKTLSCIGRMNKYFVNNEGIRFDAGLVETTIAGQAGITLCAIAPSYDKLIHDTVPALYITVAEGEDGETVAREALLKVFKEEGMIKDSNLPAQLIIAQDLPLNINGKVDVFKISNTNIEGKYYAVIPNFNEEELVDLVLEEINPNDFKKASGVPQELQADLKKYAAILGGAAPNQKSIPGFGLFSPELFMDKPKVPFGNLEQMKEFFENMPKPPFGDPEKIKEFFENMPKPPFGNPEEMKKRFEERKENMPKPPFMQEGFEMNFDPSKGMPFIQMAMGMMSHFMMMQTQMMELMQKQHQMMKEHFEEHKENRPPFGDPEKMKEFFEERRENMPKHCKYHPFAPCTCDGEEGNCKHHHHENHEGCTCKGHGPCMMRNPEQMKEFFENMPKPPFANPEEMKKRFEERKENMPKPPFMGPNTQGQMPPMGCAQGEQCTPEQMNQLMGMFFQKSDGDYFYED